MRNKVNEDKLLKKLHQYYNKLNNPKITIGHWNIVDEKVYNILKKITLTSISNIIVHKNETTISAESKNKFVIFKYNPAFIATKIIDTEYDYLLKDWDLIAIDQGYIYTGESKQPINPNIVFKVTGIKLNTKAKKDLKDIG